MVVMYIIELSWELVRQVRCKPVSRPVYSIIGDLISRTCAKNI